jgi:hypothetical protein
VAECVLANLHRGGGSVSSVFIVRMRGSERGSGSFVVGLPKYTFVSVGGEKL